MNTLVLMRFSFLGRAAGTPGGGLAADRMLDPDRLEQRLMMLERIALASLVDQSEPRFRLYVLSSEAMPEPYRTRLCEMTQDMLGSDRAEVVFRPPGFAGNVLRRHIAGREVGPVVQTVLDDTGALARDFNGRLMDAALGCPAQAERPEFLSFPVGLTLTLTPDAAALSHCSNPQGNLALSIVGPVETSPSPLNVALQKVGRRHALREITQTPPVYIRTVHASDEVPAQPDGAALGPEDVIAACERFPCLRGLIQSPPRLDRRVA